MNSSLDRLSAGYEGQRRFAANASHELRTPLAVQRALIEVSMCGTLTDEQLHLLARQLLHANERNVNLVEGLLVLAESDRGLASSAPVKLDAIAEAVVAAHEERAAEAGITVRTDFVPCLVRGEHVLLERLVTNLVQNAITYNHAGGSVTVEIGGQRALRITNTGQHIRPDEVDSLFEPFRRLDRDRINSDGGVGLGLPIVRSIALAHQGQVVARAHRDGGLTIELDLPRATGGFGLE